IDSTISDIQKNAQLLLAGGKAISFNYADELVFLFLQSLPFHPNAVTFQAFLDNDQAFSEKYYSIGGGFVVKEGESNNLKTRVDLPFPIEKAGDLLHWCLTTGLKLSEVVMENESAWRTEAETRKGIMQHFEVM